MAAVNMTPLIILFRGELPATYSLLLHDW